MDFLAIAAIILAIVGFLGSILPVLPGPPLSFLAVLCAYFSSAADERISLTALCIYGALALVITIMDYVLPGVMTRVTGGHKSAERGAMIGMIAGLVLTPIGMVLGSFLGAFLGEKMSGTDDFGQCLKAAFGAFVAFILSTGIKLVFAGVIIWKVFSSVFAAI